MFALLQTPDFRKLFKRVQAGYDLGGSGLKMRHRADALYGFLSNKVHAKPMQVTVHPDLYKAHNLETLLGILHYGDTLPNPIPWRVSSLFNRKHLKKMTITPWLGYFIKYSCTFNARLPLWSPELQTILCHKVKRVKSRHTPSSNWDRHLTLELKQGWDSVKVHVAKIVFSWRPWQTWLSLTRILGGWSDFVYASLT